jgi:hypothetical protein
MIKGGMGVSQKNTFLLVKVVLVQKKVYTPSFVPLIDTKY